MHSLLSRMDNHMTDGNNSHELMRFIRVDDSTRRILREAAPHLTPLLPMALDQFYEQLRGFPQVSRFFSNPSQMSSARSRQIEHWKIVLAGNFDDTWLRSARTIGEVHSRIGLEAQWYMAGYSMAAGPLFAALADLAASKKVKPGLAKAMIEALNRAIFLDMATVVSVYEARENDRKNRMQTSANSFVGQVQAIVKEFAGSSTTLDQSAKSMIDIANRANERAGSAADSAREATRNVSAVAGASTELGRAIQEISRQASQSAQVAGDAVDRAEAANTTIAALAASAERIGEVVTLISEIAAQTNLLALNATIESARAGEAGRGFGVVAQEVKNLANQTARATDDIRSQIGDIQATTREAVDLVRLIRSTIEQISHAVTAITAAVEEQGAVTQEIAHSTGQAAEGARGVASDISDVQTDVRHAGQSANQVVQAAETLSRQSEFLRAEAAKFMENFKAA